MVKHKDIRSKAFLLLLAILIPMYSCESGRLDAVPTDWVGEWRTEDKKFEGFAFEITGEALVFSDAHSEDTTQNYRISWIQKNEKVANLFTIHYKTNEGLKYDFSFYYDPADGGTITLKNQKKYVWKKVNKQGCAHQ